MVDLMADQLCLAYEEYTDLLQLGSISGSSKLMKMVTEKDHMPVACDR